MGDGFVGPDAKAAGDIVESLNSMFSLERIDDMANKVDILRNNMYPQLLQYDSAETSPRKLRQSSLRFAAWVLTSNIVFSGPHVSKLYPANKFVKWLKWTRWLDRNHNPSISVWVSEVDGQDPIQANLYQPADAIIDTINQALTDKVPIHFDWTSSAAAGTKLEIKRGTNEPPWLIKVTSPDSDHLAGGDDGDDFADH